jgi:hypothetical protein
MILHIDELLVVDQIKGIQKNLPTSEEINQITLFRGDPNSLGKCEQFFLVLMKVTNPSIHLDLLLLLKTYQNTVKEIESHINTYQSTLDELMTSNKIRTLFSVILRVGNYVNGDDVTLDEGCSGFKFETLEKLNGYKSKKHRYTIVHYIHEVVKAYYQESSNFTILLENLDKCKRIDLDDICESLNDLSALINKCQKFKIQAEQLLKRDVDLFYPVFDKFQKTFGNKLNDIKRMREDCLEKCREVILFYGEEPDKVKIGAFIEQFYLFVLSYVKAGDDLEREKQDKESAKKRFKMREIWKKKQEEQANLREAQQKDQDEKKTGLGETQKKGNGLHSPSRQIEKVNESPPKPLKPIHWTQVPESQIKSTIFNNIDDEKININEDLLLELFEVPEIKTSTNSTPAPNTNVEQVTEIKTSTNSTPAPNTNVKQLQ